MHRFLIFGYNLRRTQFFSLQTLLDFHTLQLAFGLPVLTGMFQTHARISKGTLVQRSRRTHNNLFLNVHKGQFVIVAGNELQPGVEIEVHLSIVYAQGGGADKGKKGVQKNCWVAKKGP